MRSSFEVVVNIGHPVIICKELDEIRAVISVISCFKIGPIVAKPAIIFGYLKKIIKAFLDFSSFNRIFQLHLKLQLLKSLE